MTAPHIALLLHSPEGGGAQRRMLDLSGALVDQGFAVSLVLIEAEGALKRQIPESVQVDILHSRLTRLSWMRTNRQRQSMAAIPALAAWLRHKQPDILMAGTGNVHLAAISAHAMAGAPCPLVLRAHALPPKNWGQPYARAQAVAVPSDDLAAVIRALSPAAHVAVLPNPVVGADFPSRMAAPVPHPWLADGQPVIMGCGRLEPDKDFPTLIRACARLGIRLIILGEGSERARLCSLAEALRVPLELPGFVADPLPWMAHATIFALSSAWESMPAALVEAMACGCPAIATRCPGGTADILDGLGPLVPVGDDRRLAEALAHVLAHPPPRAALIRRAQTYSVAAAAKAYGNLFMGLKAGASVPT
ncbi:MAG: glycosyltransferase [Rhodospirillaceae bacterium]|nr:glycosyltransferase [Rhodospirillales bacterium]